MWIRLFLVLGFLSAALFGGLVVLCSPLVALWLSQVLTRRLRQHECTLTPLGQHTAQAWFWTQIMANLWVPWRITCKGKQELSPATVALLAGWALLCCGACKLRFLLSQRDVAILMPLVALVQVVLLMHGGFLSRIEVLTDDVRWVDALLIVAIGLSWLGLLAAALEIREPASHSDPSTSPAPSVSVWLFALLASLVVCAGSCVNGFQHLNLGIRP